MLKTKKQMQHAYRSQGYSAKERNIEFNLTWQEWITWWIDTGHVAERGAHKDEYVMSRFNDTGPYELGNIKCITQGENKRESCLNPAQMKRTAAGVRKAKLGKTYEEMYGDRAKSIALKISKSAKGQIKIQASCIYCKKTGQKAGMTRFHFDNCRNK